MTEAPGKIKEAFAALAKGQEHLYLKRINGRFYVYKQTFEWQRDKRKSRTISNYIGRITPEGTFIKRATSYKDELAKAVDLVVSRGGEIAWHGGTELKETSPAKREVYGGDELALLMALSMNSRMPIPRLAEFAGLNEQTAYSRLKSLEEKLGIRYLLEIDVEKLGYIKYLILIRFEDAVPTIKEFEEAVRDEPRIQFVATTKGDYDVVMYVIDEDPLKANYNFARLRSKPSLKNYKSLWNLTYFAELYSFMPLRETFIENVLKDRVWHRSKETPRPEKNQLKNREFLLLKELNSNSTANFSSTDKKLGLNKGTSRYAYQALKERGIIVRPTITMTGLPFSYIGMILITNIDEALVQEHRYKYLFEMIQHGRVANKYSLMGNIGSPNGGVMFVPVTGEEPLEKTVERIDEDLRGSIVKSLVVTNVITGSLCYRRFDNAHSVQHRRLIEFKKVEPIRLVKYD